MESELQFLNCRAYKVEPLQKFAAQTHEHYVSIATQSGVLVLKLHPDFDRSSTSITYCQYFLKPSDFKLINHIDVDVTTFFFDLPQHEIYSCLLQKNITSHLANIQDTGVSLIDMQMSSSNLIGNECVLAIIGSFGCLELFVRIKHSTGITEFESLANLTTMHIERFKYKWSDMQAMNVHERKLETIKRLEMHMPKAMVWTHLLTDQFPVRKNKKNNAFKSNYASLIVAYEDGRIVFWRVNQIKMENYENFVVTFIAECQSDSKDITAISWCESIEKQGLLLIGYKCGKVVGLPVLNLDSNNFRFGTLQTLCSSTEIAVDCIRSEVKNNNLLLYIVQQSHMLFIVINHEGNVCESYTHDFNNHFITDLQKTLDGTLLLTTLTGVVFELKVDFVDNRLDLQAQLLKVDIPWKKNFLIGCYLSRGNSVISFLTHHHGYNYKGPVKMRLWNYTRENDPLTKFMQCNRISDNYDLIEVMKVVYRKKKEIMGNVLPAPNYDELEMDDLKKYLIIAKLSEAIFDHIETVKEYRIKRVPEIKTLIFLQFSFYLLEAIVKELDETDSLTEYQRQVAHTCLTFLRHVSLHKFFEEHDLAENYAERTLYFLTRCKDLDLVDNNLLCVLCEEPISGLICFTKHADNRCAFTLVQITHSRFHCSVCGHYIAEEASTFIKEMQCPLCDADFDVVVGHVLPYERKACLEPNCMFFDEEECESDDIPIVPDNVLIKHEMVNNEMLELQFP